MESERPWLSMGRESDVVLDTDLVGEVLSEYRASNGLSQADLARLLSVDQSYVSKIETGQRQVRDMDLLLQIAHRLNIPPGQLGLSREAFHPKPPPDEVLIGVTDPVESSQVEWRRVRRYLNRHRGDLARMAAGLYRPDIRVNEVPIVASPEWMPAAPLRLENVELKWTDHPPSPVVTGTEPEAQAVLPLRVPGHRFDRYTAAIRYLDPPSLFENRASYRLLDAELSADAGHLEFGLATYFDKLDASEAIAHELAAAVRLGGRGARGPVVAPSTDLPLRGLVGDPLDLRRRMVMPAIETLTLRRQRSSGRASFLLHWRDPAKVATAAGIYGLIPAGEFQPSSVTAWDRANDFDLWRNIVREYSEELLGSPEQDGTRGEPIEYDGWPLYRDLQQARLDDRLGVYCLGVGIDTLTLTATILTVVVIDDDVFDELFGEVVRVNAEGVLVTAADSTAVSDGVPFTEDSIRRLLTSEPMASPGACILARAWRHREKILARASG